MPKILNQIIKTSIYLLVFLLPLFFLPFSFEAFEFNKQYLLLFLVSLSFFSWLAKMVLVDKQIKIKRTPLDTPILLFLLVAVISAVFSIEKISSLFGFYGKFSDGLVSLINLAAMYFLIVNNVGTGNQKSKAADEEWEEENGGQLISIQGIFKTFIFSIFFVVLLSYLSVFGIFGGLKGLPAIMLQNTFNPVAGSLEGLAIFLAVAMVFLTSLIISDSKLKDSKIQKLIIPLLLLSSLALLIVIDFNRAWILLLTTLFLCVAIALAKRIFKEDVNKLLLPILLIVISAIFIFVDSTGLRQSIFKTQFSQEQVLSQKDSLIVAFKSATVNIKSGLIGSGMGTFFDDFNKFKPKEFNQNTLWQIRFDRPSNYFAEILATTGFLGLLSYLFLVGIFLMIGYLFIKQNRDALPLIMTFLALLVGQFVFYQNTVLAFCFWLFMALSAVVWQKTGKEKVISLKSFPEMALIFSVVLMVLGLGILSIYFFAGKFYLADVDYQKYLLGDGAKLEEAVKLNPYQPMYKIVLTRSYLEKLVTESRKPVDQIDQNLLSTYAALAINYAKGIQSDAMSIKGATELAPNNVMSWEALGITYRQFQIQGLVEGASDWAIKSFEKAISLEPTNPILHTELGKMYLAAGNTARAKEEFAKAKELKPDYIDASFQEALIFEKEDNLDEAVSRMENLVKLYPTNPEVILELGRLYYNNGETNKAITQFQAAISLEPNYSNAHYSLGIAYEKIGEINKAIAEYEKVLALNPGNTEIQAKINKLK